jgi:hypothetical protein
VNTERIELFRSGTHTDSAGNTRPWSQDDVRDIANIYNQQYPTHEAPAVLGHPEHNDPAYGWVERLDTEDGVDEKTGEPVTKLFGTFKDFVPEFIDMVKRGLYKKRSIALYADKLLRHVGWLGAMPPAIKGLANPQFNSAAATITFEFSDEPTAGESSSTSTNTTMDPEVQSALDAINKRMDSQDETLKQLLDLAKADEEEDKTEDTKAKEGDDATGVPVGNAGLEKQPAFSEEADKRLTAVERENQELKRKLQDAEFNEFLNSDEVKKRVVGKEQRQAVLDEMRIMAKQGEHEFSDGKRESALERYKRRILALPELIEFGEIATQERAGKKEEKKTGYNFSDGRSTYDDDRRDKVLEARELAKKENISIHEAARRVMADED